MPADPQSRSKRSRHWISSVLRHFSARLLGLADRLEGVPANHHEPERRYIKGRTLLSLAVAEYLSRRKREEFISRTLLGEPAWDIMIDLYIQQQRGQFPSVGSASDASGVPDTSARRWLDALEAAHLLEKGPATFDRRAQRVALTEEGHFAVSAWLRYRAAALF